MGSRGAGSGRSGSGEVPFDKWGKEIDMEPVRDKNGDIIGYINDETRYIQEPDIRPVTKKQVLDDINAWRMDDGTYGDEDTAIYLAYNDGSFVNVGDLDGKAYKKTGIIGASISTADYEMVWGGELNKKTGKIEPWKTNEFDDNGNSVEGFSNTYSGYKATGSYKVRVKTTYNEVNPKTGRRVTKYETLRKSSVKKLNN